MKAGIRRIAMVIVILALLSGFPLIAYAANGNTEVSGKIYELGKDSHYVIGEASPSKSVAKSYYVEGGFSHLIHMTAAHLG